jgi:hypothetical protein
MAWTPHYQASLGRRLSRCHYGDLVVLWSDTWGESTLGLHQNPPSSNSGLGSMIDSRTLYLDRLRILDVLFCRISCLCLQPFVPHPRSTENPECQMIFRRTAETDEFRDCQARNPVLHVNPESGALTTLVFVSTSSHAAESGNHNRLLSRRHRGTPVCLLHSTPPPIRPQH